MLRDGAMTMNGGELARDDRSTWQSIDHELRSIARRQRELDPLPKTVFLCRHHLPRCGRPRPDGSSNREKSCLKVARSDAVADRDFAGLGGAGLIAAHSSTQRRSASERLMRS